MKLRCVDGIVRYFEVAHCDGDHLPDGTRQEGFTYAYCRHCSKNFGCHDTKVLKPIFKNHICSISYD